MKTSPDWSSMGNNAILSLWKIIEGRKREIHCFSPNYLLFHLAYDLLSPVLSWSLFYRHNVSFDIFSILNPHNFCVIGIYLICYFLYDFGLIHSRFFLYIFVSGFKNKNDSPSIHFKYLCSEKILTFDRSGESWSSFGFYNVNNLKKGRLSILFL